MTEDQQNLTETEEPFPPREDEQLNHIHDPRLYPSDAGGLPQSLEIFEVMAEANANRLAIPRSASFTRQQVIQALQDSFELIGGVPRMAAWAHTHPTQFYQLYAKLAPSNSITQTTHDGVITIQHALQPGPLDKPALEHKPDE